MGKAMSEVIWGESGPEGIKCEALPTDHTIHTRAHSPELHRCWSFLSLQPVDSSETEAKGGSVKPGCVWEVEPQSLYSNMMPCVREKEREEPEALGPQGMAQTSKGT